MDSATDRAAFWDTGDDRSRVFTTGASIVTVPPVARTAPPSRDLSRYAANEETAAAAVFLRLALRAAG